VSVQVLKELFKEKILLPLHLCLWRLICEEFR